MFDTASAIMPVVTTTFGFSFAYTADHWAHIVQNITADNLKNNFILYIL